jgi:hypothetical protein
MQYINLINYISQYWPFLTLHSQHTAKWQYMPLMDERNTQYKQCSKTSQELHSQQNTVLMGIEKINEFNLHSVRNFTPPSRISIVAVSDNQLYHRTRQYDGF